MIEEQIKALLAQQNKKVKDLCAYIDLTDAGLRKIYARDSCEISTLKKIANFFNVSPCIFLEGQGQTTVQASNDSIAVAGNVSNVNSYKAIQELLTEITAQRKMTEKAMEQIDRLVGVISELSKHN